MGKTSLERMAIVQRKMLRLIVGWNRIEDEPWKTTMQRMKIKVSNALHSYFVESWDKVILERKWSWANRILGMSDSRWARRISYYDALQTMQDGQILPNKRKRRRPRMTWEDDLNAYAYYHGYSTWQDFGKDFVHDWTFWKADFINFTL